MTPRPPRQAAGLGLAAEALGPAIAYLGLSWWLGYPTLVGDYRGADWGNAVTIATWLERHLPATPFWFPYQGAGVSFTAGYATWPIWWATLLAAATALDVTAAMRLVAFLAVPTGALGTYVAARVVGLGAVPALVAGALFALLPANWNVFYRLGFYSNAVANGLAPWVVALAIGYARSARRRLDRRGALLFAGAAGAAVLAVLAHPVIGAAAIAGAAFAIVASGPPARGWGRLAAWTAAWVALVLGWLVAFVSYSVAANREGLNSLGPGAATLFPPESVLGLVDVRRAMPDLIAVWTIPPGLWLLALAGAVVGARREPIRGLAVTAVAAFAVMLVSPLRELLHAALPPLAPLFSQRGVLALLSVLVPILAVVAGAWATELIARRTPRGFARGAIVVLFAATLVAGEGAGYGVWCPELSRECPDPRPLRARLAAADASLLALPLPRVDPATAFLDPLRADPRVRELLDVREGRADLSPELNALLLGLNAELPTRVISLYAFQLSLIHESWGDVQRQLYLPLAYGIAEASPSEVARWHGLNRVAVHGDPALRERYAASGWRLVYERPRLYANVDVNVWESPERTGLAATRTRGVVLHVGSFERKSYTTFSRLAGAGALGFEQGWTVEWSGPIDDLGPDELARFDAVVLDGYGYRDRRAAFDLLERYVRAGGSLFVDTGWQFVSPEWEAKGPLPAVLALRELRWQELGRHPRLSFTGVSGGPDLGGLSESDLGDFAYGDGAWGVSTGDEADLRAWAQPLLRAEGRPLIAAGTLGEGRIVWSGMNLTNHVLAKQRAGERELLSRLLAWLVPDAASPRELASTTDELGRASVAVEGPGWVLWREPIAFAEVRAGGTAPPAYRAGPGYVLAHLDRATTLTVAHDFPAAARVAGWFSVGAALLTVGWLLAAVASGGAADPGAFPGAFARWVAGLLARRLEEREVDA